MRPDAKGFTLSELLVVFVIVILIGALMLPLIRYSQIRMERIRCANNLREIGLAMYIYAREHDGSFPPGLSTLYEEKYLADGTLMDCPGTSRTGTPEGPEYIYTAGLSVRSPSLAFLARDSSGNHGEKGGNVLYVNGAVEWREGD